MDKNESLWKVFAESAFTRGNTNLAAPELARQIEERIHAEGHKATVASVDGHSVVVRCDDEFGIRLNDLPGASYAVRHKP